MALEIIEKDLGGITALQLSGRLTLGGETSALRLKVKEALAQGKKRLVLDLASVSYLDSAGLGTLVAASTSAHNEGAVIKIANLTKQINQLMQITRLVTVFDVFDSVEAAVKSFGQTS